MYAWRLRNLHNSYSYMISGKKSYLHFPVLWIICMYLNVLGSRVHRDCIITSSHALHINAGEIEYIVVLLMFKTVSPFTPSKCGMKINIINVSNERFNYTRLYLMNMCECDRNFLGSCFIGVLQKFKIDLIVIGTFAYYMYAVIL